VLGSKFSLNENNSIIIYETRNFLILIKAHIKRKNFVTNIVVNSVARWLPSRPLSSIVAVFES
jgi:hypothetical protein